MAFSYRKLSELTPLENNPRTINEEDMDTLVQSIKSNPEYFEARPIILSNRTGQNVILAGNQRYQAAKILNLKEVPTFLLEGLTEVKEREIVIRDNISNGKWDYDTLANEWNTLELRDWGFELPSDYLFNEDTEPEEDNYIIPTEIKTDIVLGDLFEIGGHRLLCGDSTDADAVGKLLNGKEPYLMVTDPPYGVQYDASWRDVAGLNRPSADTAVGKVLNDDKIDWTESWALSPSKVAYVWSSDRFAYQTVEPLIKTGFEVRNQIIWAKNQIVISRGNYHPQHEPCWYAVKKGNKGNWAGDRKQSTLWNINKPLKSETGHSTQKPVECMARPISNHDGDVYDPFLGSGTTMVAAHQLNRKCYGMELDPKYCQVIVDRMIKSFPDIEIKKNGKPYTIN